MAGESSPPTGSPRTGSRLWEALSHRWNTT